jgi:hypothetical protein
LIRTTLNSWMAKLLSSLLDIAPSFLIQSRPSAFQHL